MAGRPKDLEFTRALARHGLTREAALLERASATKLQPALLKLVRGRIRRDFAAR